MDARAVRGARIIRAAKAAAAAGTLLLIGVLLGACGDEHSRMHDGAHSNAAHHDESGEHGAHAERGEQSEHEAQSAHAESAAHGDHDEYIEHGENGSRDEHGDRIKHSAHDEHNALHGEKHGGAHEAHGDHDEYNEHGESGAHAGHEGHAELPAEAGIPGESLYQLQSAWQTDTGETIRPARLSGKVVVGAMIYASCEYACPIIVSDMKHIEAALPKAVREKTRFVLFSFDPERDTVEKLAAYRRSSELLGENWTLLRAVDATVRELAVVLGVRYKKVGADFAHSNLVFVLDAEGVPAFRKQGLGNAPDEAVAAVRELAARIP